MPNLQQSAHFFDRVPASDAAAATVGRAYIMRDPATGHYVLASTLPLGAEVPAYLMTAADGVTVVLTSDPPGDRSAALYDDGTVQLL